MQKTVLSLCAIAVVAGAGAAFAADPPPAVTAPPGSAVKDCTGPATAARKECEKIAKQMDQVAQGKAPPPPPGTDPNAPESERLHHSSPIMQTPEQKAAANAVAKGQDPKKAVDKLRAKERQSTQ